MHGQVRIAEERLGRRTRSTHGDADAGGNEGVTAFERVRLANRGENPLDSLCRGRGRRDVLADDPVLVGTEAGDGVGHADQGPQPIRHGAQQQVAAFVATGAVEQGEAIQVDVEDRDVRTVAERAGRHPARRGQGTGPRLASPVSRS